MVWGHSAGRVKGQPLRLKPSLSAALYSRSPSRGNLPDDDTGCGLQAEGGVVYQLHDEAVQLGGCLVADSFQFNQMGLFGMFSGRSTSSGS